MEVSLLLEAFKSLIAAGPVAVVLGSLCWVLWRQNGDLLVKLDAQHDKMLRLALRVQRAVEVLAGTEKDPTEVEALDNEEKGKKKSDEETPT